MNDPYDRTCHAWTSEGAEIVRYERAGKWFLEYPPASMKPRRKLSLKEAVELAVTNSGVGRGQILRNRAGGQSFNTAVVKAETAARRAQSEMPNG